MTNQIRRPSGSLSFNHVAATAAPAPRPIGYFPVLNKLNSYGVRTQPSDH